MVFCRSSNSSGRRKQARTSCGVDFSVSMDENLVPHHRVHFHVNPGRKAQAHSYEQCGRGFDSRSVGVQASKSFPTPMDMLLGGSRVMS